MKVLCIHRLFLHSLEQKPNDKTLIGSGFCKFISAYRTKGKNHLMQLLQQLHLPFFFGQPDSKSVISKTAQRVLYFTSIFP